MVVAIAAPFCRMSRRELGVSVSIVKRFWCQRKDIMRSGVNESIIKSISSDVSVLTTRFLLPLNTKEIELTSLHGQG